jgi:hypothetical protein
MDDMRRAMKVKGKGKINVWFTVIKK